ncbi:MAG TPA: hypothetical protein VGG03_03400 [Thermoanaerobaculia bacterium]
MAIDKVLEALSWIFDWSDILNTHTLISNTVLNAFETLQENLATLQTTANSYFSGLEAAAQSYFDSIISQIGSQTPDQAQAPYADPTTPYTQNGTPNTSVQSNWMMNKLTENSLPPNGSVTTNGQPLSLVLPRDATDPLVTAVEDFIADVIAAAAEIAEDLADTIKDSVQALLDLISTGEVRDSTYANLLSNLGNLIQDLLQLGQAVVDDFFDLLASILSESRPSSRRLWRFP